MEMQAQEMTHKISTSKNTLKKKQCYVKKNINHDDKLCTHVHILSILGLCLHVGTYFIVLKTYMQVLDFLNFVSS